MPATEQLALLPLFRSGTQLKILGELAEHPEREWSIQDLADRVDAPYSTVWREVDRLRQLGVVTERRAGSAVQVRFDDSLPYAEPLRQLLSHTYGPLPGLAEELEGLSGIVDACIYGSWARRYAGELGPAPRDIDVLILVESDADPLLAYQACSRVSDRAGRTVNATVLTADEWAGDRSAFAEEVRSSPRVGVLGDDYARVKS